MALRTAMADLMLPRVAEGPVREQLRGLFKGELPLGQLCDVLAFALPLPPEAKQELCRVAGTQLDPRVVDALLGVLDAGS